MLPVTRFTNDCLASCAYVVCREGCPQAFVIDPADDAQNRIVAFLEEHGLTVGLIALTHEHFDHIAGAPRLRKRYGSPLVCSQACSERIVEPTKNFSRYLLGSDLVCDPADLILEEIGHELDWCGLRVEFIPTPGHSPGSVCIAVGGVLFTGDTLIYNIKTVTKLPGGNRQQLVQSIDLILTRFSGDTMVYPGHGEPFQLRRIDRDIILGRGRS